MENVPLIRSLHGRSLGLAAVLSKFKTWDEAISMVNDSKFGLQAGIFTREPKVQQAWDEMKSAAWLLVTYRPIEDNMP